VFSWLESGFQVYGINLSDLSGPLGRYSSSIPLPLSTDANASEYSGTMVRTMGLDLLSPSGSSASSPDDRVPRMTLRRDLSKDGTSMELLGKDGKPLASVDVFIRPTTASAKE
jgi:hypothetical protein